MDGLIHPFHRQSYRRFSNGVFRGDARILGYQDSPCPTSRRLENCFYPSPKSILEACMSMLQLNVDEPIIMKESSELLSFKGPF